MSSGDTSRKTIKKELMLLRFSLKLLKSIDVPGSKRIAGIRRVGGSMAAVQLSDLERETQKSLFIPSALDRDDPLRREVLAFVEENITTMRRLISRNQPSL